METFQIADNYKNNLNLQGDLPASRLMAATSFSSIPLAGSCCQNEYML